VKPLPPTRWTKSSKTAPRIRRIYSDATAVGHDVITTQDSDHILRLADVVVARRQAARDSKVKFIPRSSSR